MKKDSENFRESAIFDVIEFLKQDGKQILVYEPLISTNENNFDITFDLKYFKETCDLILANRMDEAIEDVTDKVFTRDVYGES